MRRAFTLFLILLASFAAAALIAPPDPWSQLLHVVPILLVTVPSYFMGVREGRLKAKDLGRTTNVEPASVEPVLDPPDAAEPTAGTVRIEPITAVGGPCRGLFRCKLPGGWLVGSIGGRGQEALAFYPDPDHAWDGNSLQ